MMKTNIQCRKGRVLIEVERMEERRTDAGLVLPAHVVEDPMVNTGTVIATGIDEYPPGTVLMYIKQAGTPVRMNSKQCKFLQEGDILGFVLPVKENGAQE